MSENIQIEANVGSGYWRAVEFGAWTTAFLNYADWFDINNLFEVERHHETDEVFVLIDDTAYLIIAGCGENPDEDVEIIKMEKGKMYNVKKDVWHQIIVSKNASTFIAENSNTTGENSEKKPLCKSAVEKAKSVIKL